MNIRSLSKSDWDSLFDYAKNNVSYYVIPGYIKFIGTKVIRHGKAPTFGPHEQTYDILKKMFSIPFSDLPKYAAYPAGTIEGLWKVIYLWRLERGI